MSNTHESNAHQPEEWAAVEARFDAMRQRLNDISDRLDAATRKKAAA